jgi:hypothetical protein
MSRNWIKRTADRTGDVPAEKPVLEIVRDHHPLLVTLGESARRVTLTLATGERLEGRVVGADVAGWIQFHTRNEHGPITVHINSAQIVSINPF